MPNGSGRGEGAPVAGRHQAQIGAKRMTRRSKGRRGPHQHGEPYNWRAAGAVTFGVVASALDSGIAHADTANRSAGSSRLRGGVALRSVRLVLLAVLGAICVGMWSTITTAMKLAAATALIMGGTQHPLSVPPDTQPFVNSYVAGAQNNYIVPGGFCPMTGCATVVAVVTPEQFFPIFGSMTFDQSVAQGVSNLNNCVAGSTNCVTNQAVPGTSPPPYTGPFVIYGYSQSATIATLEKRTLAAEQNPPATSFLLLENPNRPNGGILARAPGLTIPILGVTFSGPTPTNTPFPTIDVARQYDGIADAPVNPLNLLADINAGFGYAYLHGSAPNLSLSNAQFQGQFGDTSYYLYPTQLLPVLMPLAQLGVPSPILAVLDAPLRVLVEAGYNRTISPGQPTPANLLYFPNPAALAVNLIVSIPTGVDNGLSTLGLGRPLGTQVPGPYGVGGPPVDPPGPSGPAPAPLASTISPTTHSVAAAITSSAVTDNASTPMSNTNAATTNNNPATTNTDTSTTGTNSSLANTNTSSPQVTQTTSGPSIPPVTRSSQPTIRGPAGTTNASTGPTTLSGVTTKPSPPTTGDGTAPGLAVLPAWSTRTTSPSNSSQSSSNGSSSSGASSSSSNSSGGSPSSTK
jgi:hypothetical protein